jgi:hypothetical protein
MAVKLNMIWKNSMSYGAYTGFGVVLLMLILYFTNHFVSFWQLLSFVMLVTGLTLGTINYRNRFLDGYISYGNALMSGLLISVFTGIIVGFFMFVLITIDPDFPGKRIVQLQELLLNLGVDSDTVEEVTSNQARVASPIENLYTYIVEYAFRGFIVSLIMAAFVKRERSLFDTPDVNAEKEKQ